MQRSSWNCNAGRRLPIGASRCAPTYGFGGMRSVVPIFTLSGLSPIALRLAS
jgi:hypothetical protein